MPTIVRNATKRLVSPTEQLEDHSKNSAATDDAAAAIVVLLGRPT